MRAEIEKLRGVYLLQDGKKPSAGCTASKPTIPSQQRAKAKMAAGTEEKPRTFWLWFFSSYA